MSFLSWIFVIVVPLLALLGTGYSSRMHKRQTTELALNLTTNSPPNCGAGLSYSGVLLMVEYRLVDCASAGEWIFLHKIVMNPTDSECTNSMKDITIPYGGDCHIQLRIVQPEHGGGQCNCWGISDMVFPEVQIIPLRLCRIKENVPSRCEMKFFCEGDATSPRGVVFYPFHPLVKSMQLDCPSDSRIIDEKELPSVSCENISQKLELMYELNLTPGIADNEGVEVSVGNWDNNGKWIPLVYHGVNPTTANHRIRGFDVDFHTEPGVYSVTVCGQSLRDGLQIRWLQEIVPLFNASGAYNMSKIVTLGNVRANLYVNETSIQLLPNDFNSYKLRNVLQSTLCPRTANDKFVFGFTCTTLGCERYDDQTIISRLVTTMPLNVSKFLNSSQSHQTVELALPNIEYIGPVQSACPAPTVPDTLALQELRLALVNVSGIINGNKRLMSIQEKPSALALAALSEYITDKPHTSATVVIYLLGDILNRLNNTNCGLLCEMVLAVSNMVIINQRMMSNEKLRVPVIAGSSLLATVERLALYHVPLYPVDVLPRTENIVVVILEVDQDTEETYFTSINEGDSSILVPFELLKMVANGTESVTVVSVYYRNMSGLLPGTLAGQNHTTFKLASPVMSTSLLCGDKICDTTNVTLNQRVIVTLKHSLEPQSLVEDSIGICVFWEFLSAKNDNRLFSGNWRTDGCTRNNGLSNSSHTVCECTHLTNFAILLSANPISLDSENKLALKWIGYIGVSLSVLAMLCTIVALGILRSLWSMRNFVHINLCVSLILAQLAFVIGINQHGGGNVVIPSCRTAAVLMHYLFLVSFMWMLMEGVVLYIILVKVFVEHKKRYLAGFMITSYGIPLLYMALCVPLGFFLYPEAGHGYGYSQVTNATSEDNTTSEITVVCWLNFSTNFVLTFIVPVVLIILINIGFFIMTITIIRKHAKRQTHWNLIRKARHWLKSSVSLVTVMGLTWVSGISVFRVQALLPLAYIFTIAVAFQGVAIFVIFVLVPQQIREAYLKWWRSKVAEAGILNKMFGNMQFDGVIYANKKIWPNGANQEQELKTYLKSKNKVPTSTTVLYNKSVVGSTPKELVHVTTPVRSQTL